MRRFFTLLSITLFSIASFTSCDDDDEFTDVPVTSVKLKEAVLVGDEYVLNLTNGQAVELSFDVQPANASFKTINVTNISEDNSFLSIAKNVITPTKVGVGSIRINSTDGSAISEEYKVVVAKKSDEVLVESITLEEEGTLVILEGRKYQLKSKVLPANASNPTLKFEEAEKTDAFFIAADGTITAVKKGETKVTVKATDGTGVASKELIVRVVPEYDVLDSKDWTVATSVIYTVKGVGQNYVTDGNTGKPEHILDGNPSTFLSLIKPQKKMTDEYVAPDYGQATRIPLFFVIDMKAANKFDYVEWAHRKGNGTNGLRARGIDVYGSATGADGTFVLIKEKIALDHSSDVAKNILNIPESEYRFIKIEFSNWSDLEGVTAGSSLQIGEVSLGINNLAKYE